MSQSSPKVVEDRLHQSEIQEDIWKTLQMAQENITVTISKAAGLFGLTESRLREWDKRGLLLRERHTLTQESKSAAGHRQYSSAELEKLAIISVLLKNGVSIGDIPPNVDELWHDIAAGRSAPFVGNASPEVSYERVAEAQPPIDQYEDILAREESWRYFVAQSLRISLHLLCERIPESLAGIIVPLEDRGLASQIVLPNEVEQLGPSLVGWLGKSRSFSVFLHEKLDFKFPSDFRVEKFVLPGVEQSAWKRVINNVIFIVQRDVKQDLFTFELVETICRLLSLVYERQERWRSAFAYGKHDWLYQAHDLERASQKNGDLVFNALLERIIELGGQTDTGQMRWRFCALLVPNDANLPIQQQALVVRAQTELSPYKIGLTTINQSQTDSTQSQTDSLSQKAFLSGQIISFAEILSGQSMVSYQLPPVVQTAPEQSLVPYQQASGIVIGSAGEPTALEASWEEQTRSAIAIPIMGEYGVSAAVLYIAAERPGAFSREDQRVLRLMGRMIEEALLTSRARRQVVGQLGNMITRPEVVDPTFQGFGSETDFLLEIEKVLQEIQQETLKRQGENGGHEGELALVSVDIDGQSGIALKYGNRVARNLSHQMGIRILRQRRFSDRYLSSKVFHIAADKYYWLLPGVSLTEAQDLAWLLKGILEANYKISPSYIVPGTTTAKPVQPDNMLELTGITVHLGISFYRLSKLAALLSRYPESSPAYVYMLIVGGIEEMLERGKAEGGNCIFSWLPEKHNYGILEKRLDSTP